MIKLVSAFLNSAGKKHTFSVKDPNTDLSPAEIKQSLELLTSLTIFEKDGVALFQEVVSAKFVETIETPVFTGDEFFGASDEPIVMNQPMLNFHPTVPELDVQIDEVPVKEADPSKLEELKAQSSYRALPAVPQVSLTMPKETETTEVLEETPEPSLKQKASTSFSLAEMLQRRKKRRKAKEKQKKNPD
ncbi:DUF2922 domain-containing protein [Enterococcus sp. 669A]|uniref:DUF2922 domain-containing protein n=1 Tax=Candidatus Enterococcus moelleringii TaxID=2815325 RepID=A0ABS3L706_9ENTE|nr:DUF2922 domain-containing protein [Enterococcus sp. 669A]MBO1305406.1 DUF2922 domain-containing protein [Enterococcus sp. 669A]